MTDSPKHTRTPLFVAYTATIITKHERCECGRCRCEHVDGYLGCEATKCRRYTWPGRGADLPADHARGKALKNAGGK